VRILLLALLLVGVPACGSSVSPIVIEEPTPPEGKKDVYTGHWELYEYHTLSSTPGQQNPYLGENPLPFEWASIEFRPDMQYTQRLIYKGTTTVVATHGTYTYQTAVPLQGVRLSNPYPVWNGVLSADDFTLGADNGKPTEVLTNDNAFNQPPFNPVFFLRCAFANTGETTGLCPTTISAYYW
jgi:hypothetical protein